MLFPNINDQVSSLRTIVIKSIEWMDDDVSHMNYYVGSLQNCAAQLGLRLSMQGVWFHWGNMPHPMASHADGTLRRGAHLPSTCDLWVAGALTVSPAGDR